jgi:general secretion pathway protein D
LLLAGVCLAADAASSPAQPPCSAENTAPACTAPASLPTANQDATTSSLTNSSPTDSSSVAVNPAPAIAPAANAADTAPSGVVPPGVNPSTQDRKAAKRAFEHGLKLEHEKNLDEAFYEFEEAARLVPMSAEYVAAREMTREHLAGEHLQRGNTALEAGKQIVALAEFREALNLDPQNDFAQQRIHDALGAVPPPASGAEVVAGSNSLSVKPVDALRDIHFRGDSRGLLTAVASSYGLTVIFDDTFPARHVTFDMDQVDFATAIREASAVTKSFCVALEDTVLFAAVDNAENHRLYDRMGMRSFYIPGAESASDLNGIMSGLRTLFDFRFVSLNAAASTITVRGPLVSLQAATELLEQLDSATPEVLLDLQVVEVNHTYAKNIGLHVPDQFNLYNIPASALAALGGQNIQQLINELISSGGINQAGNTTIAALLAQLMGQGNSIFSQPLATFGGGLTFFGLTLDQLAGVLSLNESSVQTLQHVTLRAEQNKDATFKLGSRYPVMNASFAPLSNSSAIAGVLGNQSYTAPFPSVSYEDLGLTLKAKPLVHRNSDVSLQITVQFRALAGGSVNSIPIIDEREYTGGIVLKDGEPAAIAGVVTESDQRSVDGLPTFAEIPGFGLLVSQHSRMEADDELMILLTPHVVREAGRTDAPPIWLTR